MSKKKGFVFEPELWLSDRRLRTCSPAARGFCVDLLALCYPSGYLLIGGVAPKDKDLASITGLPVGDVRKYLAELGQKGIFHVSENDQLFFNRMVKSADFSEQAKEHGRIGQAMKKVKLVDKMPARRVQEPVAKVVKIQELETEQHPPKEPIPAFASKPNATLKAASLPWYKSPAGWVRKGQEQAMSYLPFDDFEEFQYKLSCRIPPGPHLDQLTPTYRKMADEFHAATKPNETNKSFAESAGLRR